MAIFADVLSSDRAWFGEQRVGFGASLDGPRLDAAGPVAHPRLSDQDTQAIELVVAVEAMAIIIPGDP